MNIVHVKIENMLGLTEADIKPGKITLLEGKNGAGKSGVIDAILAAFDARGIEGEKVTQGAEKGRVFIKLDDGHAIRASWSPDGKKTVSVTTPDGDTKKAPQTWLDGLFGAQVVNPVAFISAPPAEQRKIILQALPITVTQDELQEWFGETLPVDVSKHGLEVLTDVEKTYVERRRNTNTEGKSLKSEIEVVSKDIPADFKPDEWEAVDTSSLTQQLQDIGRIEAEKRNMSGQSVQVSHNAAEARQDADKERGAIDDCHEKIAQLKQRIGEYEEAIVRHGEKRDAHLSHAADLDAEAEKLMADAEAIEVPDKAVIEQKLADYSQAQRVLQQIANRERLQADFDAAKAKAEAFDAKVELARQKPKELLKQAEFPIEGLEFTDKDILINGLSIDSLSDGEKLVLGLNIAKAMTGELGFICLDGAETLDEDNLKWLLQQADDKHHFYISRVGKGELQIMTSDDPAEVQAHLFPEDDK